MSSGTIVCTVVSLFSTLYPDTMVSTTNADYSLTVSDSSGEYTLKLMTIVALVTVPVVLIYTAWSYWVFRTRVTGKPTGRTAAHAVLDAQVLEMTAPTPAPEGPAAGADPES
jgi:cytochrome bd-type quinol oxidase subunit 2